MKASTITVTVLIGLLVGCSNVRETASDRQWEQTVTASYDQESLLAFLKKCIAEHPEYEGVKLSEARTSNTWVFYRRGPGLSGPRLALNCGDWALSTRDTEANTFELTWDYEYPKVVILECQRLGPKQYRLKHISKTEWLLH